MSGGRGGGRIIRDFGMDMDTLLYLKWIAYKDLPYSAGTLLDVCGCLDGRGAGGKWIQANVGLNPFAVHLKTSQH